jgi:hypothetical protein
MGQRIASRLTGSHYNGVLLGLHALPRRISNLLWEMAALVSFVSCLSHRFKSFALRGGIREAQGIARSKHPRRRA